MLFYDAFTSKKVSTKHLHPSSFNLPASNPDSQLSTYSGATLGSRQPFLRCFYIVEYPHVLASVLGNCLVEGSIVPFVLVWNQCTLKLIPPKADRLFSRPVGKS